jgi:pimeloyl-ACP methyl ester carboxylesterase
MNTTDRSLSVRPSRREFLRAAAGLAALSTAGWPGLITRGAEVNGRAALRGLVLPEATEAVTPFVLKIPQSQLDDLRRRLKNTIWPNRETVADWSQGVPVAKMKELVSYWQDQYDWRRFERYLNGLGQYRTKIDGLGIHFLHIRSKHPNALAMVMTHGWPGSIVEFVKLIGPLTDPVAHGGTPADAFHLVIPSLPGFAFSDQPTTTGWNCDHIAKAWNTLMLRLGYERYVAQGGDWGAVVTTALGQQQPPALAGIHLNWAFCLPKDIPATGLLPDQQRALKEIAHLRDQEFGFYLEQSTRPQTIGYPLADSPAGLLAWIYEKFHAWSDPASVLGNDEILDNIMLYWLTDTAASSARIYWENPGNVFAAGEVDAPAAVSVFPHENFTSPESWTRQEFTNLVYFNNQIPRGGHFAAFEQPDIFVQELRNGLRSMRS